MKKFDGGPAGVDSLAAAISEERGTIEDVLEPYLIQQGFLMRTSRGRIATRMAYEHFGLPTQNVFRNNWMVLVIKDTNAFFIKRVSMLKILMPVGLFFMQII